jgi:2-dehydropantoate 2-reductase
MKIAVIGSGSVGCFYGAKLAQSGHDVRFLMRRDLEAVRRSGLTIKSCDGDFHIKASAFGDPAEIGQVDLVVCALKATAIDAAEKLVRPCIGPGTRILALMNGMGIEERFVEWFGPQRVFGGMAFVCINRGEPGVVHHLAYGRVAFGHFQDDLEQVREMAGLFGAAGIETMVRPSLQQARWEKLMWNIPFSTLTITAGGVTTHEIVNDPGLRKLAWTLMQETARAGNAHGCTIDVAGMTDKMMSNTLNMPPYRPSMLVDYLDKQPLEVEAILGEPVRRATAIGVPVPTIETQYHLTSFLDKLNRGVVHASQARW